MIKTKTDEAMERFVQRGYKYTEKRAQMLQYLISTDRYLSAKEITEYMRSIFSSISYDTIYRNLSDFVAAGLVEETEISGGRRFRIACDCIQPTNHHHHHFICTNCGTTIRLNSCPMDFFSEQLPGCTIEGHKFEIYGLCEKCKNRLNEKKTS